MYRALIFTAKDTETDALRAYLDGPIRQGMTSRHEVFTIWKAKDQSLSNVEIAHYESGRGQEAAAIYCPSIAAAFEPHVVIFLGCAGGEPNRTNIGDIFVASEIWPYEKAKVDYGYIKSKSHPLTPDRALIDQAKSIKAFNKWRNSVIGGAPNMAKVHIGPIASGEKVIIHNRTRAWAQIKTIEKDIIAVETEGHGFLAGMATLKTYSLMIRGISDNLIDKNSEGKDIDDNNQTRATSNAAAFTLQLLKDIDFNIIERRGFVASSSHGIADEFVICTFKARAEQLKEIYESLSRIVPSELTIVKVNEGSLVLMMTSDPKAIAYINALYAGHKLGNLLSAPLISLAATIVRTGEVVFDAYLNSLRHIGAWPSKAETEKFAKTYREWADYTSPKPDPRAGEGVHEASDMVKFQNARRLMEEAGLRTHYAAEEAGMSQRTLQRVVKGQPVRRRTALNLLEVISRRLERGLDPRDYIFPSGGPRRR